MDRLPFKLKIYKQKWKCPTRYKDECRHPKNFDHKKILKTKVFRSYTDMANYLDNNKQLADHVMTAIPKPLKTFAGIKNVVFDGVDTWVEKYGHV